MVRRSLIYEVEITKENIAEILTDEIFRLIKLYGPRIKEDLEGIVLPPSSYKCFELFCANSYLYRGKDSREAEFMGVRILLGSTPFLTTVWRREAWHRAHQEARRFMDASGGVDS